jgi:ATP-dependent protease Clp ATPase subunit
LIFSANGGIPDKDHSIVNRPRKSSGYFALMPSCSFCGRRAEKGQKFVEGPGVYICDSCVALCANVLSNQTKGVQEQKYIPRDRTEKREIILCSFCGKERHEVGAFFTRPGIRICDACIALCASALSRQKPDSAQPSEVRCSFCGNAPRKGHQLVAGPGVHICDVCVSLGTEEIATELKRNSVTKRDSQPKPAPAGLRRFALCSFCGKRPDEVRVLIDGPGVYVCDACIDVSVKALSGKPIRAPGIKITSPAH